MNFGKYFSYYALFMLRITIFISGSCAVLLLAGTSFRIVKEVFTTNLHDGTFLHLHLHCFEIEYFCFGFLIDCSRLFDFAV